jgi:exosome complex component RRP4
MSSALITSPGALLCEDRSLLRGHGTYGDESGGGLAVRASCLGEVRQVARWLSVAPARVRYAPEVGDIVVGRVREVAARRWLVDVGARAEAALPLAAVALAGGDQRRRTLDDALAMRGLLAEGDLLCAEVHALGADGGLSLHARSLQFGRLANGLLLRAPPRLLPRQKAHVVSLPPPLSVDAVLGVNGWIWLTASMGLSGGAGAGAGGGAADAAAAAAAARTDSLAIEDELAEAIEARKRAAAETPATPAQRLAIAALRATVLFCCERGLPITVESCTAGATAVLRAHGAGAGGGGGGVEDDDGVGSIDAAAARDDAALAAALGPAR